MHTEELVQPLNRQSKRAVSDRIPLLQPVVSEPHKLGKSPPCSPQRSQSVSQVDSGHGKSKIAGVTCQSALNSGFWGKLVGRASEIVSLARDQKLKTQSTRSEIARVLRTHKFLRLGENFKIAAFRAYDSIFLMRTIVELNI